MTCFPILIFILTFSGIVICSPLQKRSQDGTLGAEAKSEIQAMIDASLVKDNEKQDILRSGNVTVNVSPNKLCPIAPPTPLTGIPISTTVFKLEAAVVLWLGQANGNAYCRELDQKLSIGSNIDLSILDHTSLSALTFPIKAGDTIKVKYSVSENQADRVLTKYKFE